MPARVYITWTRLILLCVIWTLASNHTQLVAQDRPETEFVTSPQLNGISFSEFRRMVLDGEEVVGRIVPSSYIVQVLEDAPQLLGQSSYARLKLNSCRISGPKTLLRLPDPSSTTDQHASDQQESETPEYLKRRNVTPRGYVSLQIEIRNTICEAGVYFPDVVFQKKIIVENSLFRTLVSFQGVVFQASTQFNHVHFGESSDFSGTLVLKDLTFDSCDFKGQGNFSRVNIGADASVIFKGDRLDAPLDFSESVVRGKLFFQGSERALHLVDKVYLNRVNKDQTDALGELVANNVEFHDSVYLDQSQWAKLDLAETQGGLHRPIRFDGFCDFRHGTFGVADFGGAEFNHGGDFSEAVFRTAINFERTKLRQPIRIAWRQIAGKLGRFEEQSSSNAPGPPANLSKEGYEELERNFRGLEDLYSENECRYERRTKMEGKGVEWAISGYWVRPKRTLLLIVLLLIVTSAINWWAFCGGWQAGWFWRAGSHETLLDILRVPSAVQLALYATALKTSPPIGFEANKPGRIVFWTEYAFFKATEVVLMVTISNTSPLLKQLIPYVVPG